MCSVTSKLITRKNQLFLSLCALCIKNLHLYFEKRSSEKTYIYYIHTSHEMERKERKKKTTNLYYHSTHLGVKHPVENNVASIYWIAFKE